MKKIIFVLSIPFLLAGCEELEVTPIDYRAEMYDYILNTLDGQELYSTNIYPQEHSFALDDTEDRYYYQVDNVGRSMTIDDLDLEEPVKDVYPYTDIRDAVVTINDDFEGSIMRIRGDDTTVGYKFESNLKRYAYFLKIYDDTKPYAGWRLWGYSCLYFSPDGFFYTESEETFYATRASSLPNKRLGEYYIVDDYIAKLPLGDSITFYSNYSERLFVTDQDEDRVARNTELVESVQRTGWRVPSATSTFFQLIAFDSDAGTSHFRVDTLSVEGETVVVESTLVKIGDYIIPFKVDI